MEMKYITAATVAAILAATTVQAAPTAAIADETCFTGDHAQGTLEFSGAVEGSGFSGTFGEFSVTYCMPDGKPADGRIEVQVELASADSGNRERDEALKGEEFFAVEQHPRAEWSSSAITCDGDGYVAEGELMLKGIRAGQAIRFTLAPDGDGLVARGEFVMSGAAEVDRQRFEVGTGEFADPEFVRNRVDVDFEVRLAAGG